jgi:hypothetical protein
VCRPRAAVLRSGKERGQFHLIIRRHFDAFASV